ncbi:hypothetical protein [Streptomyces pactum]|uniref:hypothetical protein n=1 Tax=Streptomyces pactum TaxID=68249 RepID=UPI0036F77E1E
MGRGTGTGRRVLAADRHWAGEARTAAGSAVLVLGALLGLDRLCGTLSPVRAACWAAVAATQLSVLHPPLVTAGEGWLASRGLFRERLVRTDLLASVSRPGGVAPRLVLRDVLGHRVEIDPRVLTANPLLWHQLDRGVRLSRRRGLLHGGTAALAALGDRIDGDGARALLGAAGLSPGRAERGTGPEPDRPVPE